MTITGLFFSRIALSVGMLLLLSNALATHFRHREPVKQWLDKGSFFYMILFLSYLITGLYSEDITFFWERIRVNLPLLVLPFAFSIPLFLERQNVRKWFLLFYIIVICTALHSTIHILFEYRPLSTYNGMRVTTPINHVRYSLMVAFAIFLGFWLSMNPVTKWRWEKAALLVASVFLLFYLHLLSVRSGILGFYVSLGAIGWHVFTKKRKQATVLAFLGLAMFCAVILMITPPAYHKVITTIESIRSLVDGEEIQYLSDAWRVNSIKAGMNIGFENFWTGVGIGDLSKESENYYQTHHLDSPFNGVLPHNQFVFVFAGTGIFGLMLFSLAVLYPITQFHFRRNYLAISFNAVLLTSFFFDHTLETQIGLGFYLFFQMLLIQTSKMMEVS